MKFFYAQNNNVVAVVLGELTTSSSWQKAIKAKGETASTRRRSRCHQGRSPGLRLLPTGQVQRTYSHPQDVSSPDPMRIWTPASRPAGHELLRSCDHSTGWTGFVPSRTMNFSHGPHLEGTGLNERALLCTSARSRTYSPPSGNPCRSNRNPRLSGPILGPKHPTTEEPPGSQSRRLGVVCYPRVSSLPHAAGGPSCLRSRFRSARYQNRPAPIMTSARLIRGTAEQQNRVEDVLPLDAVPEVSDRRPQGRWRARWPPAALPSPRGTDEPEDD